LKCWYASSGLMSASTERIIWRPDSHQPHCTTTSSLLMRSQRCDRAVEGELVLTDGIVRGTLHSGANASHPDRGRNLVSYIQNHFF
jgi:hypothetical protein